jgi:hypothetical protein
VGSSLKNKEKSPSIFPFLGEMDIQEKGSIIPSEKWLQSAFKHMSFFCCLL